MKKTRQKLGLTQEQIAKELNCSLRAIWKIENSEMSRSLAQRYYDYLSHKLFEKNALILSEACINRPFKIEVTSHRSKINGTYYFEIKSNPSVKFQYVQHSEKFVLEFANNVQYHEAGLEICSILNNKLKSL